ncbi:MAG: hypothetical protein H8K08_06650 [Nitrospira sp.]|nr:hypothetical protein [Nitrospira sp.]
MDIRHLLISTTTLLLCAGCTGHKSMYQGMFYAEHTHVGAQVKISPQTDAKPIDVNLGYDRGLVAVVPRTAAGENAGSVISKTDLEIVFLSDSKIKNVFATGVAAKNLARDGSNVSALFSQCFDETNTLKGKKLAALEKLSKYRDKEDKDSLDKLEKLHKIVFPTRSIYPWTTRDEILRSLSDRVEGICDSNTDVKLLDEYSTKL